MDVKAFRTTGDDMMDLNVDTPEKVADVLRFAAEKFEETQTELQSAWQDKHAGYVWHEFAKILRRAAKSCDTAVKNYV